MLHAGWEAFIQIRMTFVLCAVLVKVQGARAYACTERNYKRVHEAQKPFLLQDVGRSLGSSNLHSVMYDAFILAGSLAAEEGTKGWTAVAGLGAAWAWGGAAAPATGDVNTSDPSATGAVDAAALAGMQRLLSAEQPRIRVIGGARFNGSQAAAPEWAPFGRYAFVLPQLEFLEASECNLLACTLAWDAAATASDGASGAGAGSPAASAAGAAAAAAAALAALRPPAPPTAPAFNIQRSGVTHDPSESQWREQVPALLQQLAGDAALSNGTQARSKKKLFQHKRKSRL